VKQSNKPEDKFETVLFLPEGEGRQGEGGLRTNGYLKVGGIMGDKVSLRGAQATWQTPADTPDSPSETTVIASDNSVIACEAKQSTPEANPLITVVTVVYNGEKFLEETILSVINQTYDNVEYIIIDGGSTDGTLDIIKKYEHAIDYWVSEKDKGIYDAMNKGIDLATGEWINFMNAGDCLNNYETLKSINYYNLQNFTMLYGKTRVIAENQKVFGVLEPLMMNRLSLIIFGTRVVCHQAVFYRSRINFRYPERFKLKGELYSFFEYLKFRPAKKIDVIVCDYLLGGIGEQQRTKNSKELWGVMKEQVGWLRVLYLPMYVYQFIRRLKKR
jgi:glycosyltransferase involved in cell wall biosynthesis